MGEVNRRLDCSINNRLTLINFWYWLRFYFDISGRINSRLFEITGLELAVVVELILPGDFGIIKLLGFYVQSVLPDAGFKPDACLVHHVKFANRRLLDLSEMAVSFGNWT